jgi:hypothetical protein
MTKSLSGSIDFVYESDNLRKEISDFIKKRINEIEDEKGSRFTLEQITSSYSVAYKRGTKNKLVIEIHLTTERK